MNDAKNPKKIFNKRQHERLAPDQNILVYSPEILGQVLDISKGGLAFAYRRDTAKINNLFLDLDLMCNEEDFNMPTLFCKTISDVAIEDKSICPDGQLRRCSVEFRNLSDDQYHLLEKFLRAQDPPENESKQPLADE